MDPDGMQIILRKPFFDYYYSDEIRRRGDIISEFQVLHFNGLPVGQPRDKVNYPSLQSFALIVYLLFLRLSFCPISDEMLSFCPKHDCSWQVMYRYGVAKIVDPMEENPPTRLTTLDRCLRTKWPTIQVTWQDGLEPVIE